MRASHPGAPRRFSGLRRANVLQRVLRPLRVPAPLLGLAVLLLLPLGLRAQGIIYAPGAVDFGTVLVGGEPTAATLRFTVAGNQPLTIGSVQAATEGSVGEDYSITATDCVGTLSPPSNCSVSVNFAAEAAGLRRGAITLEDASGNPLVSVVVHGVGSGPELVFAPGVTTTTATVAPLLPPTFQPSATVFDGAGDLFFNDFLNQRVLEKTARGVLSVAATSVPGSSPSSMAIAPNGTLFLTSPSTSMVFTISAGLATNLKFSGVKLKQPTGIAIDPNGYLYVADATSNTIVRAGLDGSSAAALPLTGLTTPLSGPIGLTLGPDGYLYVVDSNNERIVRINLTTYAAAPVAISGITLDQPYGIATDPEGTLYVADAGNRRVVMISTAGVGTVLSTTTAPFLTPTGVALSSVGDIAVADNSLGLIVVTRSSTTVTFPTTTPVDTTDSVDGNEVFSVQNIGNTTAQLAIPAGNGLNPSISTNAFAVAAGSCPLITSSTIAGTAQLTVDASCTYGISFTPTVVGLNTASLLLSSGGVGTAPTTTQTVTLNGNASPSIFSLSIVASPSTVVLGNSVGLTISAGGPDPASYRGTITFTATDPGAVFNTGASYTFTAADAGTHTFAPANGVLFSQTGIFTISITDGVNSATSNPVTVTQPLPATTTTVSATPNPVFLNAAATITATVSPVLATGVPTGTVMFYDGGPLIGQATLMNGMAQLPTSFNTAGPHQLTAVYSGDTNFGPSTSAIYIENVNGPAVTATTLSAAPNPAVVGTSVTLTAGATSATAGTLTGTVAFYDGGALIGVQPLVAGVSTLPMTFLTTGNHNLTAVYSGDTFYATSTSAIYVEVINPAAVTTTTLSAAPNPAFIGDSVTLTSAVASTTAGVPTGNVAFYDGATLLGTQPITGATESLTVTFSTAGNHNLTAVYSGDPNFATSTSAIYVEVINPAAPTVTTVSAAPNPALVGATVQISAVVVLTGSGTSSATTTGSVTFFDGGAPLGTATVTNGFATLAVTFSTAGPHLLTAVYTSTNTQVAGSTSAPFTENITAQMPTTTTLTAAPNPSLVNSPVVLTATVTSANGTPDGTVTFFDSGVPLATVPLTNGAVSYSAQFSTVGSHGLTVVYSGSTNFLTSSSPVVFETIEDIAIAIASTGTGSASVFPGKPVDFAFSVSPVGGSAFIAPVTFSVSGQPTGSIVTFSPVSLAAGDPASTLTVTITPPAMAQLHRQEMPWQHTMPVFSALLLLPLALLKRRRRRLASLLLLFVVTAATFGLSGCLSDQASGYFGQVPESYNITVTATSGVVVRTVNVTLVVE